MSKGTSNLSCFPWNFRKDHTIILEESSWEPLDQRDVRRGRERLKRFCCFNFWNSISTQCESSLVFPNFNRASLIVAVRMYLGLSWMIGLTIISDLFPFQICSLTVVSIDSLPFFVVDSERRQEAHQNFLIFLKTSTRLYHYTLGAFMGVIGSNRW